MSDKVEKEEVQAILDAVADGSEEFSRADVQPRNFRQPRRLSRERLQYSTQIVNACLQGIGQEITAALRQHHRISLASISEINVLGMLNSIDPPFLVDVFESGGHVSWVLWDSVAAAATVDVILAGPAPDPVEAEDDGEDGSSGSQEPQPRRLSPSESRVIESLLGKILVPIASAFGLEVSRGRLAQEPEELTTLEDCGPGADARRLMLHFLFEGPGGLSDIRVYLPDVSEQDRADPQEERVATPLPDHLGGVDLEVAAYLASVDVPLDELMTLEVGDVIPLSVEVGSHVDLYVEDRCCARAVWGRHRGQQAVRISELHTHPGEIEEPTDSDT